MTFASPFPLQAFYEAYWAMDPNDCRSTSGAEILLGSNFISWWSKKQAVVIRSSADAEYCSLAQTTSEILWVQTLLNELGISHCAPRIYCDNQSAIALAHNHVLHAQTKHMKIDLFFVR